MEMAAQFRGVEAPRLPASFRAGLRKRPEETRVGSLRRQEEEARAEVRRRMQERGIRIVDVSNLRQRDLPLFDRFYSNVFLQSFPAAEAQSREAFFQESLFNASPAMVQRTYEAQRADVLRRIAFRRRRYGSLAEVGGRLRTLQTALMNRELLPAERQRLQQEQERLRSEAGALTQRFKPLHAEMQKLVTWKRYMQGAGKDVRYKLLLAVDRDGRVLGGISSRFDLTNRAGFVGYNVVHPQERSSGMGTYLYDALERTYGREFQPVHRGKFLMYGEINPVRAPVDERDRRRQKEMVGEDTRRAVFWTRMGWTPVGPLKGGTLSTSRAAFYQPGSKVLGLEPVPLSLFAGKVGPGRFAPFSQAELKRLLDSQYRANYPLKLEDRQAYDAYTRQGLRLSGNQGLIPRSWLYSSLQGISPDGTVAPLFERRIAELVKKQVGLERHSLFQGPLSRFSEEQMRRMAVQHFTRDRFSNFSEADMARASATTPLLRNPKAYLQVVRNAVLREHRRTLEEIDFARRLAEKFRTRAANA